MAYTPVMIIYNRKKGHRCKRLLATDFEGTLLNGEFMEYIGRYLANERTTLDGRTVTMEEYMREITQRGMRGEIPFDESLRSRFGKAFELLTLEEMKRVVERIPLRKGAKEALQLVEREYDIFVISGGIYELVNHYMAMNGIGADYLAASGIKVEGGKPAEITPLMDKSLCIEQLRRERRYDYVVAMGDGANDAAMRRVANRFIWIEPKDGLPQKGDIVLGDDMSMLPIMLKDFAKAI